MNSIKLRRWITTVVVSFPLAVVLNGPTAVFAASLWQGSFTITGFEGYPNGRLTLEFEGDPTRTLNQPQDSLIQFDEFNYWNTYSSGFDDSLDSGLSLNFGIDCRPTNISCFQAGFATEQPTLPGFFRWSSLTPSDTIVATFIGETSTNEPVFTLLTIDQLTGESAFAISRQPAQGIARKVSLDI